MFVCFTLSQIGMVKHWFTAREPGWCWRAVVNAFGGVLTFVVLIIVTSVKFQNGAYLVVILIPVQVAMLLFIQRQYAASRAQIAVRPDYVVLAPHREERVVIPIPGLNRAVVRRSTSVGRSATTSARSTSPEDPDAALAVRAQWERQVPGVPLVVVESPYRALVGPLLAYLDVLDRAWPPDKPEPITFVVVPEYVARHWWERILIQPILKGNAAHRPRGAAPHRGGLRPVSTRGREPVRPAAGA